MVIRGRSEEHTSELQSHSDLLSFPTRRSSDLCPANSCHPRLARIAWSQLRSMRGWQVDMFGLVTALATPPACWHSDQPSGGRPPTASDSSFDRRTWSYEEDRKSTRLNSSHTVISSLSLHDALPISAQRILATPVSPE